MRLHFGEAKRSLRSIQPLLETKQHVCFSWIAGDLFNYAQGAPKAQSNIVSQVKPDALQKPLRRICKQ
jgi:hypothetical protein